MNTARKAHNTMIAARMVRNTMNTARMARFVTKYHKFVQQGWQETHRLSESKTTAARMARKTIHTAGLVRTTTMKALGIIARKKVETQDCKDGAKQTNKPGSGPGVQTRREIRHATPE